MVASYTQASFTRRSAHDRIIHGGISGRPGFRGNGFGYGGLVGYADPDATTEGSSAPTITQPPCPLFRRWIYRPAAKRRPRAWSSRAGQRCSRRCS